jgi:hypothetical protein
VIKRIFNLEAKVFDFELLLDIFGHHYHRFKVVVSKSIWIIIILRLLIEIVSPAFAASIATLIAFMVISTSSAIFLRLDLLVWRFLVT